LVGEGEMEHAGGVDGAYFGGGMKLKFDEKKGDLSEPGAVLLLNAWQPWKNRTEGAVRSIRCAPAPGIAPRAAVREVVRTARERRRLQANSRHCRRTIDQSTPHLGAAPRPPLGVGMAARGWIPCGSPFGEEGGCLSAVL